MGILLLGASRGSSLLLLFRLVYEVDSMWWEGCVARIELAKVVVFWEDTVQL